MRSAGVTVPIMGGDGFDLGDVWGEPGYPDVYFTTHAFVSVQLLTPPWLLSSTRV
ncbi:MAG: hypothetical protein R3C44_15570 [Chloroflexota bacterium]